MKTLNVKDTKDLIEKVSDVELTGNQDAWVLLCKASSKSQGWMKSTKVMQIHGSEQGVIVQVTTQQGDNVSEALTYVPFALLVDHGEGIYTIEN